MSKELKQYCVGAAILGLAAALSSLASPVEAASISLFNTGVDSSGTPLAGGSLDPHFTIVSGPDVTTPVQAVVVTNQNAHGLYAQSPNSRWIWADASGNAGVNSPYIFRLSFDLSGFDPDSVTLSGSWAADNFGSILLNGAAPIGTGTFALFAHPISNFQSFHDFTITGGFVAGLNTLDFVITDDGVPGGLNVTNLVGTAAVPEPSSLVLLLGGFGAVVRLGARRRATGATSLPSSSSGARCS
jgi:hypothetical protein